MRQSARQTIGRRLQRGSGTTALAAALAFTVSVAMAEAPAGKPAAQAARAKATAASTHGDVPGAASRRVAAIPREVRLPSVDHTFKFDPRAATGPGSPPSRELLRAIAQWLNVHAGLKPALALPRVQLESAARITTFRFTGFLTDDPDVASAVPRSHREVVAAYDGVARAIYLPESWRGSTPVELSMLVHEMVHHLQHEAKERFACPEMAEGDAYAAQDRWLRTFGGSLESDFDLDGFTLLVVSQCKP